MNYKECLHYLYTKLPSYERQGPIGLKKDLSNTLALCTFLGDPHRKFRSVHIAGTNGKGSVSHMLSSIFQEAGFKTGLYISPHYKEFGERIRVNKRFISKKYVIEFVETIRPVIDIIRPSFFEITVAMAFKYFADKKVDIAIIETGLGGRLDSTNVISPLLSIITNISFDHQKILGNTLRKIAAEKAGIIKLNTPVLIGELQNEVKSVFIKFAKVNKSIIRFASLYGQAVTHSTNDRYIYRSIENKYYKLDMPYHGPYQEKNILTAIESIQWLNELKITTIPVETINKGLKNIDINAPLIGRFQKIKDKPTTIVDAAHNVDGIKNLFEKVKSMNFKKVHVVFGTVKDKDYLPVLKLLPNNFRYYFVKADLPRGLEDFMLFQLGKELGLNCRACGSVQNGLKEAQKDSSGSKTLVLVTGSVFVVGEAI